MDLFKENERLADINNQSRAKMILGRVTIWVKDIAWRMLHQAGGWLLFQLITA